MSFTLHPSMIPKHPICLGCGGDHRLCHGHHPTISTGTDVLIAHANTKASRT
jgi:hypothetical protein